MKKKYIVGGFCRDKLMGLKPKDKDWLLVGYNEWDVKQLIINGYQQVGADFPVFLSPAGEEHALARIERKDGTGYGGFEVQTKNVTLEQDLLRRDFTINAICYDPVKKEYIDPYGGQIDIKNKLLRHVSDAFKEDPLRVLRLARFLARLPDFKVHPSTDEMVRDMVKNGEIDHLTKERVYVEFEKACTEKAPSIFFKYLNDINALQVLLPEFKCTQVNQKRIDNIAKNCTEAFTPDFIWTVLLEKMDLSKIKGGNIGKMKVPVHLIKFANTVQKHSDSITKFRKLKPIEMVELFDSMNVKNLGGEDFLYKFCEYFILNKELDIEHEDLIIKVYDTYIGTDLSEIQEKQQNGDITGLEARDMVRELRLKRVSKMF
ncbi:tRNA nucleotidyltransferase [Xanthomonas phage XaC1]|nr:tRNA nucleotidyltransferase [Xanthomonas phage XaC1]